jgi:L-asparaginase/Glu-tRNA(Gln) amidotransferase subunit D
MKIQTSVHTYHNSILQGRQLMAAQQKKLPNVVILATCGTIAGVAASGTQADTPPVP